MIGEMLENLTDMGVEVTRRQEPDWDHYTKRLFGCKRQTNKKYMIKKYINNKYVNKKQHSIIM